MAEQQIGYYLMKLEVGNVGMPGAPILHLNLGVYAPTGQINGEAEITQAITPPHGKTTIHQVTGVIHHTGFGEEQRLIVLRGEYVVSATPPAIGAYPAHFSAALVLNPDGSGRGSFTYGNHTVNDVPVKSRDGKDISAPAEAVVTVGAVTIEQRSDYYFVTLDFTQGRSHRQVGEDYGQAIQRVYPDFEWDVYQYIFVAATGLLLWGNTLTDRIGNIKPQLEPEYRDEIEGLAAGLAKNATKIMPWGHENLAYALNLMTDILRTSKCSGLGIWGSRSVDQGHNMVLRNLDWFGGLFNHPFPRVAAVTKMIYPQQVVYTIGALGYLGVLTGIVPSQNILAAILDAQTGGTTYESRGRRSYSFDLRQTLVKTKVSIADIADFMAAPERIYAYGHLILLADQASTRVLENNIAGVGTAPSRALRSDHSRLNEDIQWEYPEMIGAVNAFMLAGQVNNFSQGPEATINVQRWELMRYQIAEQLVHKQALSIEDLKQIMSAYWGKKPRSILPPFPTGDLYNTETQQMVLYVPATNHLEIFFKPKDNSTPLKPQFDFTTVPLD